MPDPKPNVEQLQEQLRQAELAGDPWRQGIALNNLGSYFKDCRETGKAVNYFQKALDFLRLLTIAKKRPQYLPTSGERTWICATTPERSNNLHLPLARTVR